MDNSERDEIYFENYGKLVRFDELPPVIQRVYAAYRKKKGLPRL